MQICRRLPYIVQRSTERISVINLDIYMSSFFFRGTQNNLQKYNTNKTTSENNKLYLFSKYHFRLLNVIFC